MLENTDFCLQWLVISFVSFRFDLFRFVLFRFDLFRFVSICFVSFRSVSFRSVSFLFRFALYRDPKTRVYDSGHLAIKYSLVARKAHLISLIRGYIIILKKK